MSSYIFQPAMEKIFVMLPYPSLFDKSLKRISPSMSIVIALDCSLERLGRLSADKGDSCRVHHSRKLG